MNYDHKSKGDHRTTDRVLNRLKEVKALDSLDSDRYAAMLEVKTSILAAIGRLAQPGSQYRIEAEQTTKDLRDRLNILISRLGGVLRALRNDYAAGSMQSLQELIHADLFSDFLDMAEHLLEQGYKDAAAIMVGSVLEEHLRKLCDKNEIEKVFITPQGETKPKKLETINADLARNNVYGKGDQKAVTAWAEIRNNAAHGKYDEYTKEKVDLMIRGVRDFISGFPA